MNYTGNQSFLICLLAYSLAILSGALVVVLTPGMSDLLRIAIADLIATLVIFIFSFVFRNSSMYDPYWSVIPIAIAVFWILQAGPEANLIRQVLVFSLVLIWGIRLTLNWARGWTGLAQEDWRYVDLAQKTGKAYWLVSFSGIHMFPTILVFLGCLPLIPVLSSTEPLGFGDWFAFVFTIAAIFIETVSDEQLKSFKKAPTGPFLKSGLWAYSRHPNYFGEVSFWVGLFLFALGLNPSMNYWTGIGALGMLLLFLFISIPMMDKRHLKSRPGYEEYQRQVSGFFPWFPGN